MDDDNLAKVLRGMVQYEAEQAHRRVSWLVTIQGLLFAALALGWEKNVLLLICLAILGIAFSVVVLIGLLAGVKSCKHLREYWRKHAPEPEGKDVTLIFGLYPDSAPKKVYIAAEVLIPPLFICAWIGILAIIALRIICAIFRCPLLLHFLGLAS